mgnify:CR=1 FL=1
MLVAQVLIAIISILHLYFLILEMFLWDKPLGMKAFGNTAEKAKLTKVLAQNQGLYNGFLAAGLIWSLFASAPFAIQLASQWGASAASAYRTLLNRYDVIELGTRDLGRDEGPRPDRRS